MTPIDVLNHLLKAFSEILGSITKDVSVWWLLGPIILFWLVLEVYFSKYKTEKLGWNTALGNGLTVFWVSIVCTKYLFEKGMENFGQSKFIALIIIITYAIFIIINSFSHKIMETISFGLASPTITYYLSGIAILWTFGELRINVWVLIDLIIIYGFVLLFELILKKIIKGKETDLGDLGKDSGFKETDIQ